MKQIIIIICCILLPCSAMGQYTYSKKAPEWLKNSYHSDHRNSYIEVVTAIGYSEDNARDLAIKQISQNRSIATGQRVNIKESNGSINVTSEDELTVKARIIDEYCERMGAGQYRVSLLVQTARNPEFQYEPVKITNKYPVTARILVPGMAQLHKGSTGKGITFIVGEVAAIGGIVAFECMRSSYESKITRTHNATIRQDYINKADNMKNIRNGFIAGAALIYVWNIIDGAVAKGKQHIEVGEVAMNLSPFATTESAGLSFCLNF